MSAPYRFDRYRNGRLMAEGIKVNKENCLKDAIKVAARLADRGDVLVYDVALDAALAEIGGGPDWEGFGRDLLECWPVGDVDGADLFDAALRNGLIREVPGGYDPEQHTDAECICPEKGDPWYEYAFRAQEDT